LRSPKKPKKNKSQRVAIQENSDSISGKSASSKGKSSGSDWDVSSENFEGKAELVEGLDRVNRVKEDL